MKKPNIYLIFFLIMFSVSCKRSISIPKDIKDVLERAGDNKSELEEVIYHYGADIKDSLKLKAAFFLIFNIEGLKTLDTASLQANQIYFDNLNVAYVKNHKKNDFSTICLVIDSINKTKKLNPERLQVNYTEEIKTVSSDFLISNIDLAFNAWENMPWARKLSFKDFCEYVLPYRCTDTYSADARRYFIERYKILPDSIKSTDDPAIVADYIVKDIDSWFTENPNVPTKYPYLNPVSFSNLMKGKVGNCVSANSLKVTALRSLGIPAVLDEIPNWGNSNSSHYWFKVILPSKDKNPSLLTNKNEIEDTQNIISGSSYDILPEFKGVPEKVQLYYKRTVAKVYRNSFSKPSDNLEHLNYFVVDWRKLVAKPTYC